MDQINNKYFLYPPGGILIWLIILIELITFCAGLVAFVWEGNSSIEVFEVSRATLNNKIGLANTMLLLTSGFFVAEAVRYLKAGNYSKSQNWMLVSIILGVGFLILKSIEYYDKLQHGFDLSYNTFFTYYWLLTGFHFLHVVVGVVILSVLLMNIRKGVYHENETYDVETGATFWHLCDLIWLLLFPVIYLM